MPRLARIGKGYLDIREYLIAVFTPPPQADIKVTLVIAGSRQLRHHQSALCKYPVIIRSYSLRSLLGWSYLSGFILDIR
ncbi:hypothetical protein HI914_05391 [Erysiphe necator]|nr:hypothetical protein HI914_05391 [Erysiphe necator]